MKHLLISRFTRWWKIINLFNEQLIKKKASLDRAVSKRRSKKWCLRLWSNFIRARDDHRCVNCESSNEIQAHHIMRQVVCPLGMFEIGNGITLCRDCHKKIHREFNGRPLPSEPLNARGGDDQDEMAYLYGILYEDAQKRGVPENEFYYISDELLNFFNKYQGYDEFVERISELQISRIRLAHEIWRPMPMYWYEKIFEEVLYEIAHIEH
ncbi:hypothetical protein D3C74_174990 [compost metagenome]